MKFRARFHRRAMASVRFVIDGDAVACVDSSSTQTDPMYPAPPVTSTSWTEDKLPTPSSKFQVV